MNAYEQLKQAINTYITSNGVGGITGAILNSVLIQMVDELGDFGNTLVGLGFAPFSTTSTYESGDIVAYGGSLYKFNASKSAGAWDSTKADQTTFDELLADGSLNVTATDVTSKSQTPLIITNKFVAQTTGGDADLKSGDALLLNIKGNLDASLNPFLADSFVSTGMNLVDPSATLTIGGKTAYYFPVVAGNWGAYGTTQENNGFIVIGGSVDEVYYKSTKPTAGSYGAACGKTTYNGVNYYTPSAMGWLTIVCNDATVPACHVAWSNYNDTVGGTFGNTSKSIDTDVQWIHTWGMAALTGGGRSVFDEIDIESGKRYRRVDRVLLPTLTWVKTTIEGEGGNSYIYTATVTGMAANGLWNTLFANLEVDGNTIIYQSSTITTVEDLQTAMSGYQFYFELATVASATCSTTTANTVNDFGLSYFMLNGELATVPAYVMEGVYQGGKDQLFNAVTYQKILAEVTATALCNLDSRLSVIEDNIKNGFNYLKVTNLEVTRKLTQPA